MVAHAFCLDVKGDSRAHLSGARHGHRREQGGSAQGFNLDGVDGYKSSVQPQQHQRQEGGRQYISGDHADHRVSGIDKQVQERQPESDVEHTGPERYAHEQ